MKNASVDGNVTPNFSTLWVKFGAYATPLVGKKCGFVRRWVYNFTTISEGPVSVALMRTTEEGLAMSPVLMV